MMSGFLTHCVNKMGVVKNIKTSYWQTLKSLYSLKWFCLLPKIIAPTASIHLIHWYCNNKLRGGFWIQPKQSSRQSLLFFFFYYFAKILRSGGLSGTSSSFPIFKQLCLHKRTIFCYQKVTIQSTVKKRLLCIRSYQLGVNCKYIILNRLLHIISARIYCLFKYFREYKASKAPFLTQIVVLNSVRPVL